MEFVKDDSRAILDRGIFSTDASMYQITPLAVASPSTRDELLQIVQKCAETGIPVIARGGGTSLTGQSINQALVLDCTKHLNRIIELNLQDGWVRVEPGIVCAELNAYLSQYGVHFAPDPATLNRCTIGGMIANNAAGMRSVLHGMTIDHVLEVNLILSDGNIVNLSEHDLSSLDSLCEETSRIGVLHSEMRSIIQKHESFIRERYPKVIRRSGGYALDALLDFNHFNLSKLVCGSEGSLGVVSDAKLRLTPLPQASALCLAHFTTLDAALRAAPLTVRSGASAAELIDGVIVSRARNNPLTREICQQVQGDPGALLIIEVQSDGEEADAIALAQKQAEALSGLAYAAPVICDPTSVSNVWRMRGAVLGLMSSPQSRQKPTPYIEDAAIPPEKLADYVADVLEVCRKHGQPVSMFGHASVGVIHIRPFHDLHQQEDISQVERIQNEVFPIVRQYGGSWSGEHGDGIVRGGFNRAFFGDEVYGAFEKTKQLFDPVGLMNPGKVTGTPPMTSNLRYADGYKPQSNVGRYRYPQEGSLLAAAEKCSGLGACRKTLEGTMCPSYMATRDELHSTRGRANALRLALSGQLEGEGLGSPVLAQAMDLCLACTACKAECPNGVDMARLKAETLQAHHDLYKPNPRTLIFASLPKIAEFAAGPQAPIVNALVRNPLLKKLRHHLLGITSERDLPAFTSHRLSEWFYQRSASTSRQTKVIFLNETYTEHFLPEIGRAAIECLEAGGVGVTLATVTHSPRMAISQGLLDRAKIEGQNLLRTLDQMGQGVDPILVCEPSTATAIIQDLPDLVEDPEMASRVAKRVITWDKYMEENIASGKIDLTFKPIRDSLHLLIHPHCHQRQLDGGVFSKRLLGRIPSSFVTDTNSGCCGMAGTFGYEVEHVAVSHKVASHRLIPTLTQKENNERIIVANGFSCRHQISDLVPENPLHIAEVIRLSVLQES